MSALHTPQILTANQILATLRRQQYAHLFSNLQPVHLPRGKTLYELGDRISNSFFIVSAMISLVAITQDGSGTEIAMVGNEGIVGVPALLSVNKAPYRIQVQLPGRAMQIGTDLLLKEFNRGGPLHDLLLRYTHSLISQISQSAACNRFHSTQQRLCRWLLICHDRVNSDTFPLTQEALSCMLGSSRTRLSEAAHRLKDKGLIDYRRGNIKILNRTGVEQETCECYRVVTEELSYSHAA